MFDEAVCHTPNTLSVSVVEYSSVISPPFSTYCFGGTISWDESEDGSDYKYIMMSLHSYPCRLQSDYVYCTYTVCVVTC